MKQTETSIEQQIHKEPVVSETAESETDLHWRDDKLERQQQAKFLTEFVAEQYERLKRQSIDECPSARRHFVLNIDSPWGYGKTFFLERWKKDLEKNHLVLEFNAWSNDYSKDPLLSFLAEINLQLMEKLSTAGAEAHANDHRWDDLKLKTSRLLKALRPKLVRQVAIAASTAALTGVPFWIPESGGDTSGQSEESDSSPSHADQSTKHINSAIEKVVNFEAESLFSNELARKKAISEFQGSLRSIIDSIAEHEGQDGNAVFSLPIFIMVDELDRCRPDFTIELLEIVKHIFSVDDVFFIFATDGEQLQAALEGTYGASFNAETYFQRIFTREVRLKTPDHKQFAFAMVAKYQLLQSAVQRAEIIPVTSVPSEPRIMVAEEIAWFAESFGLTLREHDHLVSSLDSMLILRNARNDATLTSLAILLILFWQNKKSLLEDLKSRPHVLFQGNSSETATDRMKRYFPRLNMGHEIKTVKWSRDGGREVEMNMLEFIGLVADIFNMPRASLIERGHDRSNTFGFESALYRSLGNQGGVVSLRRNPSDQPLRRYIDDLLLSGN